MNLNDLDIAYIAHGAFNVLRELPEKERTAVLDSFSGELGFIRAVLMHKTFLASTVENIEACNGVFVYDVAEPFGSMVAEWLVTTGHCGCPNEIAECLVREHCK